MNRTLPWKIIAPAILVCGIAGIALVALAHQMSHRRAVRGAGVTVREPSGRWSVRLDSDMLLSNQGVVSADVGLGAPLGTVHGTDFYYEIPAPDAEAQVVMADVYVFPAPTSTRSEDLPRLYTAFARRINTSGDPFGSVVRYGRIAGHEVYQINDTRSGSGASYYIALMPGSYVMQVATNGEVPDGLFSTFAPN